MLDLYGVTYSEYPLKLGIITELADITLQKYVETHHPLNPFKVIDISLQICRGLKHLHSKGIVHQQLCPKKTLMKSETVLFTDFGVSKWGDNMNMGRPVSIRFMAPEQITSGFDFQADIFSFAMMFWFLKTGKNPFHEKTESMAATCFQRAERETIPDEWSEREKKLVEGCWNQSPSERMMCDDIEKLLVEMLREIN